jgi:hypothetical protein
MRLQKAAEKKKVHVRSEEMGGRVVRPEFTHPR